MDEVQFLGAAGQQAGRLAGHVVRAARLGSAALTRHAVKFAKTRVSTPDAPAAAISLTIPAAGHRPVRQVAALAAPLTSRAAATVAAAAHSISGSSAAVSENLKDPIIRRRALWIAGGIAAGMSIAVAVASAVISRRDELPPPAEVPPSLRLVSEAEAEGETPPPLADEAG